MIVVSDTSPLRYLAVLGHLDILPRLFGTVHCPVTVLNECRNTRAPQTLREWAAMPPPWFVVMEDGQTGASLPPLDAGEAAAISLALRLKAQAILIDERKGRRAALSLGFITAGTLNVLAQAGIRGWLDYQTTVATLRAETNFRATGQLIAAVWEGVEKE